MKVTIWRNQYSEVCKTRLYSITILFNLYTVKVTETAGIEVKENQSIRYADDTVLITKYLEDLERIIEK